MGVASHFGLVRPDLSFFVLIWDFPDIFGFFFPDFFRRFSRVSLPSNSTYEEKSRNGLRHNQDLSRNKWEPHCLETPRFSFSQLRTLSTFLRSHSPFLRSGPPPVRLTRTTFLKSLPPLLKIRGGQTCNN